MTTREFAASAVDPQSGWAPSKSLVGNIITGKPYKVTPKLVSAIAAGLDLDRQVVAAAAHFQAIGYAEEELSGGAARQLLHILGPNADARQEEPAQSAPSA
ncbi:hypothetical protein [Streptomyces sp. NPDC006610]|uniref:hypothetical protein n=1 Tax=Streptomyces sp. NPDC006610 TaxID=3154584 RepID=UPI0033B5E7C4